MNPTGAGGRILVVDDDPHLRELSREILECRGHEVAIAADAQSALVKLAAAPYDVMLADLVLPGTDGLALLREAKSHHPDLEVIIVTGFGGIDTAVTAIKAGAYDYVTKPYHVDTLALNVEKALERKRMAEDLGALRRQIQGRERLGMLIGRSPAMQQIYRIIDQIAPTQSSVLLLGDSGTGKEMAARTIHDASLRRGRPFIAVSCGTLPAPLLESELFGHARGAFTGATGSKVGLFEAADGGTIFLDEIGTTTPQTQVGLLRVLQEREIRRVGSTETRKVDVRIISATNADLEKGMDDGTFRQDLFYRLSSVTLRMPPLRDRLADIPLLAGEFLARYAERLGKPNRILSPRALEILCGYSWPGNIRELEHTIENAVIFSSREVVRPTDLPDAVRSGTRTSPREALLPLEEVERQHIARVLAVTAGNKLRAARILGIPRASLYRLIERHRIADDGEGPSLPQPAEAAVLPGARSSDKN